MFIATIFIIMILVLLCAIGSTEADAAVYSGYCGDGADRESVSYTLDTESGVLTVSGEGYTGNYLSGNINTAPWVPYREYIKTIVIEEGVIGLGNCAFENCPNLETVILSDDTINIYSETFANCPKLKTVKSENLRHIGSEAFKNCTSLYSFVLGTGMHTINREAFWGCYKLAEVINLSSLPITLGDSKYGGVAEHAFEIHGGESKVFRFGDYVFYPYDGVNHLLAYEGSDNVLTLPESVNGGGYVINKYFLDSNKFVTDVVIPDSVSRIGDYAFARCKELKNISFGSGVTNLGACVLAYNPKLESAVFLGNLETLPIATFTNNSALSRIVLPDSLKEIGERAFYECNALTKLDLPDGLERIGNNAFFLCVSLTEIKLPDGLTHIGDYAFACCSGLTSFTVPRGITVIPNGLLQECTGIESVVLHDGITEIVGGSFNSCTSLTEIDIPESITKIGSYTFSNCVKLAEIALPHKLTYLGSHVFYGCVSLTNIEIPDGVTEVPPYTFYECKSLRSVRLGSKITDIGENAFASCRSLLSITLPESLTSIVNMAFIGCNSLCEVINRSDLDVTLGKTTHGYVARNALEVHSGESKVKQCGDFIFYTVDGVNYLVTYQGDAEAVSLPESYNGERYVIGINAFYFRTNLKKIIIPAGVSGICKQAFRGCSNLTEVEFANTHDWSYGSALDDINGTSIPAAKLTNTVTAAKCLTETYLAEYWYLTAHTHTYNDEIVEPTCTEEGYTLHTCVCGDSYKDSRLPAYGHLFGDDGICTVCGANKPESSKRPMGGCATTATAALTYISYFFTTVIPAAIVFVGKHFIR